MEKNRESNWISISDLMTGLMVIFMFIAISYILKVQKSQQNIDDVVSEYQNTKQALYKVLDSTFSKGFEKWDLNITPDLAIQITNEDACFPVQNWDGVTYLKPEFEQFLLDFTPKFYEIILSDSFINKIAEVRVEGHTGIYPTQSEYDNVYYQKMLVLSQKRANKVVEKMHETPYYKSLDLSKKDDLRYLITSNGLAFGRTIDDNLNPTYISKKNIARDKTRRVEFKIVTNSENLMKELIKLKDAK